MVYFNNDYSEGCHPDILRRLSESNMEQTPGYGQDPHCRRAAGLIRALCCAPDAGVHFLVGGTQTNATFISSVLRPFQGVICADTGHLNVHETGAIEHSGHKVLTVRSHDGKLTAGAVKEVLDAHFNDDAPEHAVQPGMLYVSQPTELGTLYSLSELRELKALCAARGIPLYIDGARIGYGLASGECDFTLADIASIADAFYIGGTKQGALFGEALVICNATLDRDFRYNIKQNGALLAKGRLLGIQFEALFEDGLYFRMSSHAVSLATTLADAFRQKGYGFYVESPTNQIFPILPDDKFCELSRRFCFQKWADMPDGRVAVRICTSWASLEQNVADLVSAL